MQDPLLDPPDALRRDLAALFAPSAPPPAVDAAVRRAARERCTPARRRGPWRVAGAAAAALLLALGAHWFGGAARHDLLAADVDGSGRVDILDAWTLARALESGGALEPAWDLDRDGAVDLRDVRQLAQRAVRLER
jgi:hypothetical protein